MRARSRLAVLRLARPLFLMVNMEAAKRSRPSLIRKDSAMFLSAKSIRPSTTSNASSRSCGFAHNSRRKSDGDMPRSCAPSVTLQE
jgi:hypothetical protein